MMLAKFRSGLWVGIDILKKTDTQGYFYQMDDATRDRYCKASDRYGETPQTLAFYGGLATVGSNAPLNILDVGCGMQRTVSMMSETAF
jgi:hypothetical protein